MKKFNAISRRKFLAGAPLLAASGMKITDRSLKQTGQYKIKYVTLGKTRFKASNIGYGISRGSTDPSVIAYAINKGLNYFDCSEGYGKGQSEINLGKAIKKFRDKVFITTKIGSVNDAGRLTSKTTETEIRDRINRCLERLDTPYIDGMFIHGAGDPDLGGFDNPSLHKVIDEYKASGKIRNFGFSCHGYNLTDIIQHTVESGKVDLMLIAFNYFQQKTPKGYNVPSDWLTGFNKAVKFAREKNIGITSMKTFQGAEAKGIVSGKYTDIELKKAAAKWAFSNSDIDVAVLSLATINMINEFSAVSDEIPDKNDLAMLDEIANARMHSICRFGCPAPCIDACSLKNAIPDIMRLNMYFEEYRAEKMAIQEYSLLRENNAESCTDCSTPDCSTECSFGIDIKQRLTKSHELLTL